MLWQLEPLRLPMRDYWTSDVWPRLVQLQPKVVQSLGQPKLVGDTVAHKMTVLSCENYRVLLRVQGQVLQLLLVAALTPGALVQSLHSWPVVLLGPAHEHSLESFA